MALILVFLFGIGNFALHKAVAESGHPLLVHLPAALRQPRSWASFAFEFLLLVGSMLMVADGEEQWAWGYAAYTTLNGLSAWLIVTRRL